MKVLILIAAVMAAGFGVVVSKFPQIAKFLPGAESVGNAVTTVQHSPVVDQVQVASGDLVSMATSGQMGVWHWVLLVVAVLIARKMVIWILR